jgi:hypothetical protein
MSNYTQLRAPFDSYAQLGVTCDTSMRVLLSNSKFIPLNSQVYKESVKLSLPLKITKPEGSLDKLSKPSLNE